MKKNKVRKFYKKLIKFKLINKFLENVNPFTFGKLPIPIMMWSLFSFGAMAVEMTLEHEGVKKLMKSGEKFDICVLEIFNVDAAAVSKINKENF